MRPTATSLLSGARPAALFDEIGKIAESTKLPEPKWKRRLKHGAGYAIGYAAGHGAGMLIHRGAQKLFGSRFAKWDQAKRMKYLAPLIGASTAIVMAANNYVQAEHEKERLEA